MFTRSDRASQRAKRDGRVGAAETEGVRERRADGHLARGVGNEVEVAAWILLEQVHGWRRDLVAQCEYGEHCLDGRCRAEQMAGHRLGRGHRELRSMVAE